MKIFALSDFHLSFAVDKPMNIFGDHWQNYEDEIQKNWNAVVGPDDVGIIAGDISWAMRMEETQADFDFIRRLNGTKVIIRGNHDPFWQHGFAHFIFAIPIVSTFMIEDATTMCIDVIAIGIGPNSLRNKELVAPVGRACHTHQQTKN